MENISLFLSMVQYYRDIWTRHSEILVSLTNVVVECRYTKVTKLTKKLKLQHWDAFHQQVFDNVKAAITKDVTLTYPDYSNGFDIYTAPKFK